MHGFQSVRRAFGRRRAMLTQCRGYENYEVFVVVYLSSFEGLANFL